MAKHIIIENVTWASNLPSSKTLVVTGKNIRREQLLLITNVTRNTVIYNFSDPNLGATSYTNNINPVTGLETTSIVLTYDTSSMSTGDKIAFLVEETYHEMLPAEVMRDPVDKFRVSTPQSLIDTDFEYGTQPTKWESLNLLNNRPSAFYDVTTPLTVSNVSASSRTVTVTGNKAQITATASGTVLTVTVVTSGVLNIGDVVVGTSISGTILSFGNNTSGGIGTYNMSASSTQASPTACTATPGVGTPLFVQGSTDISYADGWWIVDSSNGTSFTYLTVTAPLNAILFDQTKTYIFSASFFTGASILVSAINTNGTTTVTVQTTYPHGLRVGDGIYITGTTGGAAGSINGSWVVATTTSNTTFTYTGTTAQTVTVTLAQGTAWTLFPRSLGYTQHRAFDGGVQFSNVVPYHGYQVFRQTRRYFRYQSGKGVQFSTGSSLKPSINVDSIINTGANVICTIATKQPHGLLAGCYVSIAGCNETAYNGNFLVTGAPTPTTLTYNAGTIPSATQATGFPIVVNSFSWWGNTNRVGMFDSQNGFYFEFDGQYLYAVRRSSTAQIAGVGTFIQGSPYVAGSSTQFSSQLKPGDFIAVRGMSYLVQHITQDREMYIYPEYRGTTSTSTVISKTINTRYRQDSWNIDKMDGTGASGYTIDPGKMQMWYIDYTWYGAGAIRFGLKNNRGEVIYCHRIANNNINTEAYMRSGNLPARYEINHLPPQTYLTSSLAGAAATMAVADLSLFPSTGTVVVSAATGTTTISNAAIEYINYGAKSATTGSGNLTSLTRNAVGGTTTATAFTYSATAPTSVELYSPQNASTINHWGSAVIMDGRFDDDKSFVFNFGNNTPLQNLAQGVRQPILSIRLAPSVDNGLVGLLGQRDILNRMQLTMRGMDTYTSTSSYKIELFLNGRVSTSTWVPVGGSSLAQVALHPTNSAISGGENIYGFFTNNNAATSQDLNQVRDIGNSILGGGNTSSVFSSTGTNIYPDGPDIITICATNVTPFATNAINTRISWTEAQA